MIYGPLSRYSTRLTLLGAAMIWPCSAGCQSSPSVNAVESRVTGEPILMHKTIAPPLGDGFRTLVESKQKPYRWFLSAVGGDLSLIVDDLNQTEVTVSDTVYPDGVEQITWRYLDCENPPSVSVTKRSVNPHIADISVEIIGPVICRTGNEHEVKQLAILYHVQLVGENGNSFTTTLSQEVSLTAGESQPPR